MLLFIILMLYLGSFAVKFACRRAWREAKKRAAVRFRGFVRKALAGCLILTAFTLAAAILTGRAGFGPEIESGGDADDDETDE